MARRKKPKKSLSSDWAENLAEGDKGLFRPVAMAEGVERAAERRMRPVESVNSRFFQGSVELSCGKFTNLVPLGCSSSRTKAVRRKIAQGT